MCCQYPELPISLRLTIRQLCGETHIYGFGNGSCPHACYHFYDCGETAGKLGVEQKQMFGDDPRATGGYHNFSAQAAVRARVRQ